MAMKEKSKKLAVVVLIKRNRQFEFIPLRQRILISGTLIQDPNSALAASFADLAASRRTPTR
jgi:hypothetical protein